MAKKKSKSNDNVKCLLIRISTQEILKYKVNYPQAEITPIESLDADLEWLIVNNLGRPVYDETTEKLEKVEEITTEPHPDYPELNQYKIYFNIIALTQEEIDALVDVNEDNEAEDAYQKHIAKGERYYNRSYKKVWIRVHKDSDAVNKLTKGKGRKLFRWFETVWQALRNGDFREAEKRVVAILTDNEVELNTEPAMKNTVEWFRDLIHQYYNPANSNQDNQYDL